MDHSSIFRSLYFLKRCCESLRTGKLGKTVSLTLLKTPAEKPADSTQPLNHFLSPPGSLRLPPTVHVRRLSGFIVESKLPVGVTTTVCGDELASCSGCTLPLLSVSAGMGSGDVSVYCHNMKTITTDTVHRVSGVL